MEKSALLKDEVTCCYILKFIKIVFNIKVKSILLLLPFLFLTFITSFSQTYNSTGLGITMTVTIPGNSEASGTYFKWNDPNNWSTGIVPALSGGNLTNGQIVNINHDVVYNLQNDLRVKSGATVNLNGGSFITPLSGGGFGRSVFVEANGTFNICNAEFRLPIWNNEAVADGSRTDLSGNFYNYGTVII
ncbi:MAG: hypothetical protein COA88_03860 [Kordia sp.]|nr:MAG: hypothetical protein COA88_03860 [Kordia sp.]